MTASTGSADQKPRWRKPVIGVLGVLVAAGGGWAKDIGGVKTSVCASAAFHRSTASLGISADVQRDYGPLSCPKDTWIPVRAEAEDFVDTYLARASGAVPSGAMSMLAPDLQAKTSTADFVAQDRFRTVDLLSHWGDVNWAERVGPVALDPGTGQVTFRLTVYQSPDSVHVPKSVMVRNRRAIVVLAFHNGQLRLDSVTDLQILTGDPDHSLPLPLATVVTATQAHRLPSADSPAGSLLPPTNIVRQICVASATSGERWIRTSDGFVVASALDPASEQPNRTCQAQFAARAAAGKEY